MDEKQQIDSGEGRGNDDEDEVTVGFVDLTKMTIMINGFEETVPKIRYSTSEVIKEECQGCSTQDVNCPVQFYIFELNNTPKKFCTIATPFGNYHYNCVLMGLKTLPAFAQAEMKQCLSDINKLDV